MFYKAIKSINSRILNNQIYIINIKIKDNMIINVNYQNKCMKCSILIENNFNNENFNDNIKKSTQKKKSFSELCLLFFFINATTFLEKKCIFHLNKYIKLY